MSLTTVAVYELRIHKKNQGPKDLEIISDFDNGNDLINLIKILPALLNDVGTFSTAVFDDEKNSKRLRINTKEFKPFGRLIDGELETGDYGSESSLVDAKGDDKGKVDKGTAPMRPFYFLCDIPKDQKSGFLLLQRFKQFGVFTMFAKALRQEFDRKHPNYRLVFNPIVSKKEFLRVIESSKLKKVAFTANHAGQFQNSLIVKNDNDQFNYEDAYLQVNLIAKRNRTIGLVNSVKKIISNPGANPSDYFTVGDIIILP